jgi:pyridinium-3,5-bisthiocarboxylic acid mononucleotide nickel chelatase
MIAYVEPFSGASGDMILGALLDAGLSSEDLHAALRTLPLPDWRLEQRQVMRGAIGATQARVVIEERDPPHRRLADVLRIIDGGRLPGRASADARLIFTRLAESEARVHRIGIEDVHFHEVGAADAILDICGVAAGLALLQVETLYCGPLPLNNGGSVETAHGRLPLPAPATVELLARAGAPTVPHPALVELLTPTGAAILTTLARFERPAMRLRASGYGAGSRSEPAPNLLRITLGEAGAASSGTGATEETLAVLACNLDDMNPQWYGHLFELLLARGALDVTCVPALMKKGRPGQVLSVLCAEAEAAALTDLLLAETTTLGVRRGSVSRHAAGRAITGVETQHGRVLVKLRLVGGRITQATPEYDDCRRLALEAGVTLASVSHAAQAAAYPLVGTTYTGEEQQ